MALDLREFCTERRLARTAKRRPILIRGEMGWSSFKERGAKAMLNFKVRMDNNRWGNGRGSVWGKCCGKVIWKYGMMQVPGGGLAIRVTVQ